MVGKRIEVICYWYVPKLGGGVRWLAALEDADLYYILAPKHRRPNFLCPACLHVLQDSGIRH